MGKDRTIDIYLIDFKGPNGENLCRWCGKVITEKRRYRWCSQECISQFSYWSDPHTQQIRIYERDGGKCQICGYDPVELEHIYNITYRQLPLEEQIKLFSKVKEEGWPVKYRHLGPYSYKRWYDIHHKLSVSDGGLSYDSNLVLLCTVCHKKITKEQRKNK